MPDLTMAATDPFDLDDWRARNAHRAWAFTLSDDYHGHYGTKHLTEGAYYLLSRGIEPPASISGDRN